MQKLSIAGHSMPRQRRPAGLQPTGLQWAADYFSDNGYEILAEQVRYAAETIAGRREGVRRMTSGTSLLVAVVAVILYLLPCEIARRRGSRSYASIAVVNIFLGWTVLGWVGCLAWALQPVDPPAPPAPPWAPPPPESWPPSWRPPPPNWPPKPVDQGPPPPVPPVQQQRPPLWTPSPPFGLPKKPPGA